jgi:3',5'-cyclic AMP phosphodiesterase CpdA
MRTIAHISDLHFGHHSPLAARALCEELSRTAADLVVISGDLTQRARRAEFEAARKFLTNLRQPKLVVPGNHDIPLFNLLDRFLLPTVKYDRYISPLGLPACFFADQEIAVLGLNTARSLTRKNGRVSHDQMAQLRRVFGEAPEKVLKVLVTHHPLGSPSGAVPVELAGRSRLTLQACAAAGVRMLLSGHHHRAISGQGIVAEVACKEEVLIVHAGTAISTRTRGGEANSFNLIHAGRDRVSVTVMEWSPSSGFAEASAVAYALEGGHWREASREARAGQSGGREPVRGARPQI